MSHTINLMGEDAVKKLKSLVNATPTCMFGSGLKEMPPHLCPMHVQEVDEAGDLWFFSGADSTHNKQVATDPQVQLVFCNPSSIEYLFIYGSTTISKDRTKVDELWSKMAEAWFPEGKNDPNLTLLQVRPSQAHYWDTENGKLIAFAKMLTSAAIGKKLDVGVQGDINV
jgi:general stress protein 26